MLDEEGVSAMLSFFAPWLLIMNFMWVAFTKCRVRDNIFGLIMIGFSFSYRLFRSQIGEFVHLLETSLNEEILTLTDIWLNGEVPFVIIIAL